MKTSILLKVIEDREMEAEEGNVLYLEEVCRQGCESGIVSRLIYYHQTIAFYKDHQDEIGSLLRGLMMETGLSIRELFKNWDMEDPLANSTNNQNILAWFGYEQIAQELLENPQGDVE
jgi:hypothetical protein